MKQISLDSEDERIQHFVRSLPVDPDGSVLLIHGQPVLEVHPVVSDLVDREKLKAAIFERRRQSRDLNAEWDSVDREVWERQELLDKVARQLERSHARNRDKPAKVIERAVRTAVDEVRRQKPE